MSRPAVVLLVCCALVACREDAPAPAPATTTEAAPPTPSLPATPDNDVDNALNLLYGATVVSRTGELHLESSAVHTIDAFTETFWTSAPGVPETTLVYSMLAPTRLQRVGISTSRDPQDAVESVAFDASMDGRTWTELGTLKVARTHERQFIDVKPVVARYVRFRTLDTAGHYYVRMRGVHATGEEVGMPETPPFTGCWTINGERAHLEQNGARITGVIESDPPAYIEGGTDNRLGAIMWMRGPTWGYAAITRSPDGKHLSGLSFFQEADKNIGEGWFGERCDAGRGFSPNVGRGFSPPAPGGGGLKPRPTLELFARAKKVSLYGLVFDKDDRLVEEPSAPTLDAAASLIASSPQRMRIVAHELRYDTPAENQRRVAARLQALRAALEKRGVDLARIDFVNAANDSGGIVLRSSLQRALLSRVDLVSGT
ncbi:MAG TPA: discoidin domain-containing protein [Thermoanaerobaculia bacterium]